MRVLHLAKATRIAGAERHLLALLSGLRGRGVDTRLGVMVEPNNPMDEYFALLAEREIPAERIPIQRDIDPGMINRLMQVIGQHQPDIVHTHLLHADLYGIPAAKRLGLPVVSTRHNDNAFRRRAIFRLFSRLWWRMTDAGIAISDSLALFCVEIEGAPADKIQRIYYGLEPVQPHDRRAARAALLKELNLAADSQLVGIVCRLTEQKGVRYGLQAFAQLKDEFPGANLLIAGDGPDHAALKSEAWSLGLLGRVHFLGWRADVPALMAGLDMLLMPSLWEGFGLVLLEAMAQATPVIATNVSAIPEVVANDETGLLVPPRDADALAGALRRLLGDHALAQHLGLLGQDRVETHFSAAQMVEATAALYQRLV